MNTNTNTSLLETNFDESEIELFVEAFNCTREYAIHLLTVEQRSRIQYETYLNSQLDPRD